MRDVEGRMWSCAKELPKSFAAGDESLRKVVMRFELIENVSCARNGSIRGSRRSSGGCDREGSPLEVSGRHNESAGDKHKEERDARALGKSASWFEQRLSDVRRVRVASPATSASGVCWTERSV